MCLPVVSELTTTRPFQVEETTVSEEEAATTTPGGGGQKGFDDLLDILATSQSKLDVERHLLDMISNDPVEAATALSSLFEHNNPREQFKTRHELIDLMVKDPVAVTSVSTINSEFTFTHLRIYCWC